MKPRHPHWRKAARVAFFAFLVLVAGLLGRYARSIDWSAVVAAIGQYDAARLTGAVLLTVLSYLCYCTYDLGGRTYAHHSLGTRQVMLIAFISYSLALNIGALVGGAGIRYRLYSHTGLSAGPITRVIAFSIATNWLGYMLLGGLVFAFNPGEPLPGWTLPSWGVELFGGVLLAIVAAYLAACRATHGHVYHLRGHHFRFPPLPLALQQLAIATTNWTIMAAILHTLLPPHLDYLPVLQVLLLSAVATAFAHVPAGIGVLEAVFLLLLGPIVPEPQLFAALLTYRALYYLIPLPLAIALYLTLEARGRRASAQPKTSA